MYKLDFPSRLRKALELKNMKAIELSVKTGINKAIISEYLNGKYNAKQDNIFKLARALEVDPAWLMGYDIDADRFINFNGKIVNDQRITNIILKELLTKCTNLNDENQKKVLEIVNMYIKEQNDTK